MFKANIKLNKKAYLKCNMYFMRKFFGVKELVLIALMIASGVALFFFYQNILMFIMCGITLLLIACVTLFYFITAVAGYKFEYTKREASHLIISFHEDGFLVDTINKSGEPIVNENFLFDKIDKIAILKDKIYLYPGIALMYYIPYDSLIEGRFDELCLFLESKVEKQKFKMRTKRKQFPLNK